MCKNNQCEKYKTYNQVYMFEVLCFRKSDSELSIDVSDFSLWSGIYCFDNGGTPNLKNFRTLKGRHLLSIKGRNNSGFIFFGSSNPEKIVLCNFYKRLEKAHLPVKAETSIPITIVLKRAIPE